MTANLDIIKRAMKKIHVLASGDEPTAAQAASGMDALQSLYVELIGMGSLGRLNDVLATSNYTAKENDRIQASNGITVTLPTVITTDSCSAYPYVGGAWCALGPCVGYWDYGAYFSNPGRPPHDRTPVVVIQNGAPIYYVWRNDTSAWVAINSLGQQDGFPFADYLIDGFAAMLAERIVDDYAQEIGPMTVKQAGNCRLMLSCKYDSAAQSTAACFF